jgi:hypothetical protein
MKKTESVEEYFSRTLAIANRMSTQGQILEQVPVVEKILRSTPAEFNYVVCSIEESNDVTTMSIDELQSSLQVHKQRIKCQQEANEEQALKISNQGRGYGRGRGRSSNNVARGRGRGRQSKKSVECYRCHKIGHCQNECQDSETGTANYVEYDEHEELLLMAKFDQNSYGKNERWFLDSGCSNHMVGHKEWFFDFDNSYRDFVKLGDDSKMAVMGKGDVKLNINGTVHVISSLYYVSGLKTILLNIGQLQQKKITFLFKDDLCKVFHEDKGLLFVTTMSNNRMYMVSASVLNPMCLKTSKQESTLLWHDRYAHLSFKGLNTLSKKQMVKGLPEFQESEEKCVSCEATQGLYT